ncbi:hypothetical protein V1477_021087 [Vespula maculifrons]|uniref:Uncharacterized protein n=1 Tax=Vespula maculifrons TaxID=7453 RepID=A0ABD2AHC9_VESMC
MSLCKTENYQTHQEGACLVAKVSAYIDCGVWGMNTSYQRTSGKIVGHSFGGCGTSNTPDSALLYIFSIFIHHTSQRGWPKRLKGKRRMCFLKLNHHKSSGWCSSQFGEKGT